MPNGNVSIFQHVYPELKYALSDMVPLATVCSFDFGLAVGSGSMARTLKSSSTVPRPSRVTPPMARQGQARQCTSWA